MILLVDKFLVVGLNLIWIESSEICKFQDMFAITVLTLKQSQKKVWKRKFLPDFSEAFKESMFLSFIFSGPLLPYRL